MEGFRLAARNGMADSDPVALITSLARRLNDLPLAHLHLMRADLLGQQHATIAPDPEHGRLKPGTTHCVAFSPPA